MHAHYNGGGVLLRELSRCMPTIVVVDVHFCVNQQSVYYSGSGSVVLSELARCPLQ